MSIVDCVISYVSAVSYFVPAVLTASLFCIFSVAIIATQFSQFSPHASSVCIHFLNSTIHCPRSYLFALSKLSCNAVRTSDSAAAKSASASARCFVKEFLYPKQSDKICREYNCCKNIKSSAQESGTWAIHNSSAALYRSLPTLSAILSTALSSSSSS